MSWLEGRLPKWGPFGGGSTAVLEREGTPQPVAVPDDESPQLMILVNDASGMACFKMHIFPDAQSATDFVLYWFRDDADGFSAFWAMMEEPTSADGTPAGAIAEPLVIIKDAQRVDVVYSFSFIDIESAQEFVRDEVESGTDAEQITLYWAVPVRLVADARGTSMLRPSVPPGVAVEEESEAETADIWAAHDEPAAEPVTEPDAAAEHRRVLQEAPNAHSGVANGMSVGQETFELASWVERRSGDRRSDDRRFANTRPAEATVEMETGTRGPVEMRDEAREKLPEATTQNVTAALPGHADVGLTPAEPVAEPSDMARDEQLALLEIPADAPWTITEGAVEKQAAQDATEERDTFDVLPLLEDNEVETAVEAPLAEGAKEEQVEHDEGPAERPNGKTDNAERSAALISELVPGDARKVTAEATELSDESWEGFITLGPADIVVLKNGHSKVEPEDLDSQIDGSAEAIVEIGAESGPVDEEDLDQAPEISEIDLESSRAMKVKRWDTKEKPFDGFKSPPGRF